MFAVLTTLTSAALGQAPPASGVMTIGGVFNYYTDAKCAGTEVFKLNATGICSEPEDVAPGQQVYASAFRLYDPTSGSGQIFIAGGDNQTACVESLIADSAHPTAPDACIDVSDYNPKGDLYLEVDADSPCNSKARSRDESKELTAKDFGFGKIEADSDPIRVTFGNQVNYFSDAGCTQSVSKGPVDIKGFCSVENEPFLPNSGSFYAVAACLNDGSSPKKFAGWGAGDAESCLMAAATGEGIAVGMEEECTEIKVDPTTSFYIKVTCNIKGC
jgi:hypothetical protein